MKIDLSIVLPYTLPITLIITAFIFYFAKKRGEDYWVSTLFGFLMSFLFFPAGIIYAWWLSKLKPKPQATDSSE